MADIVLFFRLQNNMNSPKLQQDFFFSFWKCDPTTGMTGLCSYFNKLLFKSVLGISSFSPLRIMWKTKTGLRDCDLK